MFYFFIFRQNGIVLALFYVFWHLWTTFYSHKNTTCADSQSNAITLWLKASFKVLRVRNSPTLKINTPSCCVNHVFRYRWIHSHRSVQGFCLWRIFTTANMKKRVWKFRTLCFVVMVFVIENVKKIAHCNCFWQRNWESFNSHPYFNCFINIEIIFWICSLAVVSSRWRGLQKPSEKCETKPFHGRLSPPSCFSPSSLPPVLMCSLCLLAL